MTARSIAGSGSVGSAGAAAAANPMTTCGVVPPPVRAAAVLLGGGPPLQEDCIDRLFRAFVQDVPFLPRPGFERNLLPLENAAQRVVQSTPGLDQNARGFLPNAKPQVEGGVGVKSLHPESPMAVLKKQYAQIQKEGNEQNKAYQESLVKTWSDADLRERAVKHTDQTDEFKRTADRKISEYKASGSRTVFWMGIASKICLCVMMGVFATASLLPIVSTAPNWLPWTAIAISVVFGVMIRGKLEMGIERRKKEFEALVLYKQMLDQPDTTSTLQPRSKSDLDLDLRFKSEHKLKRAPRSRDLEDLLADLPRSKGRIGKDKSLLPTGLLDAGAKVGMVLSYYNLDVDARIAKAYVAADHYKMETEGQKKWKSLAGDVALARSLKNMQDVRAVAYALPTPYTQFTGQTLLVNEAESQKLLFEDLKKQERELYQRLAALEENAFILKWPLLKAFADVKALTPRQWFQNLDWELNGRTFQALSSKRALGFSHPSELQKFIREEEEFLAYYESFIQDHYTTLLHKTAQRLIQIGKLQKIPANLTNLEADLEAEGILFDDQNFNILVTVYRQFKRTLQSEALACMAGKEGSNKRYDLLVEQLVRFHAEEVDLAYLRANGIDRVANIPNSQQLSICGRCARIWKVLGQAISFSVPTQPFEHERAKNLLTIPPDDLNEKGVWEKAKVEKDALLVGRLQVLQTNELMKRLDKANVNHYYAKEVMLGFVIVSVLCFVEYFYFSNPWVMFGVNAAFLAMVPIRMLMDKKMKDIDSQKDALRILEGVQRGPGLLLSPSHYPPHLAGLERGKDLLQGRPFANSLKEDKERVDRLGIDGTFRFARKMREQVLPKALVNFPAY